VVIILILHVAVVAKISTDNTVCPNNALESTLNYTNVTCNCTCPGILQLLEIAKNESGKSDLLYDIIGSLTNINTTIKTTTSGAVDDILLAVEKNTSVLFGGISQLLDVTNNASESSNFTLYNIVDSLANINTTIKTTTSGAVDDILLAIEKNTSVLLGGISQLLGITNDASKRFDFTLYDIVSSFWL
jgi:hypothetical protein